MYQHRISCRPFTEHHPGIGHRYLPNLTARIIHENGGYFIRTNNMGFRSDFDYQLKKSNKKAVRILLFGDSFTAGDGVNNADRFGDILMSMIGGGIEILNFGLSHSGTDQQYLIFNEYARNIEYDILMICPLVENIRRNMKSSLPNVTQDGKYFLRPKPYFDLLNGRIELKNVPVPSIDIFSEYSDGINIFEQYNPSLLNTILNIKNRLFPTIGLRNLLFKLVGKKISLYPEYKRDTYAWLLMKSIITHWIDQSSAKYIIIVPIPWYLYYQKGHRYYDESYRDRFKEMECSNRVVLIDPLDGLRQHSEDDISDFTYSNDKHFTKFGHKALAQAIYPKLSMLINEMKHE